jgi:hypothetical protein
MLKPQSAAKRNVGAKNHRTCRRSADDSAAIENGLKSIYDFGPDISVDVPLFVTAVDPHTAGVLETTLAAGPPARAANLDAVVVPESAPPPSRISQPLTGAASSCFFAGAWASRDGYEMAAAVKQQTANILANASITAPVSEFQVPLLLMSQIISPQGCNRRLPDRYPVIHSTCSRLVLT